MTLDFNQINHSFDKLFQKSVENYILGKRYCQKCAKKAWKNEDKSQSFTMLAGICHICKKPGIVAYIEK